MKTERYLTVQECASLLRCSRQTVHNWIRSGRIPFRRFGPHLIRIPEQDFLSFLRNSHALGVASGSRRRVRGLSFLPHVQAEALGVSSVSINGRLVAGSEWRTDKARELFFYFLVANRPTTKEQILAALWPNASPEKGDHVFHVTTHRARNALYPEVIVYRDGVYMLNPEGQFDFDVWSFQRAVEGAEGSPRGSEDRARELQQALRIYQGPFLNDSYSEWCVVWRWRLELVYLKALAALAAHEAATGQYEDAAKLSEKIADIDPYQEQAWYDRIRYSILAGNHVSAVHAYKAYEQILRTELDSKLPPAFRELWELLRAKGPEDSRESGLG